MAFEVRFFKFSKRENSTALPDVTGGAVFQCTLKDNCSLNNPILRLELHNSGGNYSPNLWPDYNYCWVAPWQKFFFVSDWTNEGPLWAAHCTIDVLATYRSDILDSKQFVSYSSVHGDTWLADTRIPVLKSTQVSTASTALDFFLNDGWYILSYIGLEGTGLVALSKTRLAELIHSISAQDMTTQINNIVEQTGYDWTQGAEGGLYYLTRAMTQNDILGKAYATAPSCLRSCIWVPLVVTSLGSEHIYLGNFDTGVTDAVKISAQPRTGYVNVTIPWHYSGWRRSYCEQVYLYIPLVGMVNLSSDNLTHASQIRVDWSYTVTDGAIAYSVSCGNEIIGTYGGSCAVQYPLGVNQQASSGEVTQAIMQGLTSSVSAGITGNVTGAVMGIATASYNAMSTAMTTHPSCIGGIGGGAGNGLSHSITCYTVAHDTLIDPDNADYISKMGYPTMKTIQLSSASGYCQCANAHVATDASLEELSAITTLLNSGFYIE